MSDRNNAGPFIKLVFMIVVFVAICVSVFTAWRLVRLEKEMERRLAELDWDVFVANSGASNTIQPRVGGIQFIRQGYSIELESVSYTSEGLKLKGFVGNPTMLTVYGLSLRVTATSDRLSPSRDEWVSQLTANQSEWMTPIVGDSFKWVDMPSYPKIGYAESAPIGLLQPGMRALFAVTIPNVKQSMGESMRLEIEFSGTERYGYIK